MYVEAVQESYLTPSSSEAMLCRIFSIFKVPSYSLRIC